MKLHFKSLFALFAVAVIGLSSCVEPEEKKEEGKLTLPENILAGIEVPSSDN